jgi:hypothetical protein
MYLLEMNSKKCYSEPLSIFQLDYLFIMKLQNFFMYTRCRSSSDTWFHSSLLD